MPELEWKGAPGNIIAHGARGIYTIQSLVSDHILQGIGNDDKPMGPFGLLGKSFHDLDDAKNAAEDVEAEVSLIFCDLIEEHPAPRDKFPSYTDEQYQQMLDNYQPWRSEILSGDNHKELFRSSERYFNRSDAIHAIEIAFANKSNVYLRQAETGNIELRLATTAAES